MLKYLFGASLAAGVVYLVVKLRDSEPESLGLNGHRAQPIDGIPNGRRTNEGYVLGAMIDPDHAAILYANGIRLVMSAKRPTDSTIGTIRAAGMRWVGIPMSDTFLHECAILDLSAQVAPQTVFIHCQHGADRAGSTIAFLLVANHGWSIPDALYSVIHPVDSDVNGLSDVLREFGYPVKHVGERGVGMYSLGAGRGGLKARNDRYKELIRSTIYSMRNIPDFRSAGCGSG